MLAKAIKISVLLLLCLSLRSQTETKMHISQLGASGGATNGTIRYNGSKWVANSYLQIDTNRLITNFFGGRNIRISDGLIRLNSNADGGQTLEYQGTKASFGSLNSRAYNANNTGILNSSTNADGQMGLAIWSNNWTGGVFSTQKSVGSVDLQIKNGGNVVHHLKENGDLVFTGKSLQQVATGSAINEIGTGRTAAGPSYIDFVGDLTYSDYGLRLIRNGGENAISILDHRGTGSLIVRALDNGSVSLQANNKEKVNVSDTENIKLFGLSTISGSGSLNAITGSQINWQNTVYGSNKVNAQLNDVGNFQIRHEATGANYFLGASGNINLSVADNTASAFLLKEGTNNYIQLNTTNGSEQLTIGNANAATTILNLADTISVQLQGADIATSVNALGELNAAVSIPAAWDGYSFASATWGNYTSGSGSGSTTVKISEYTPARGFGGYFADATFSAGTAYVTSTTGSYTAQEGDLLLIDVTAHNMANAMQGLFLTFTLVK